MTRSWINETALAPVGSARSLWRSLSAPQLFLFSFAVLIAFGAVGLRLLPGLYTGEGLGWLDALYTATSAVCITGLVLVDTGTYFTPLGQAFLLLLVQVGALGIITFTTLLLFTISGRLSVRQGTIANIHRSVAPHIQARTLARDVIRFTLLIQAVGAVLLYLLWVPRMGTGPAVWPAIFHSVSAFANAGFSTFPDSLTGLSTAPASMVVLMALIVAGGIGFLTLEEIKLQHEAARRGERFQLSVHSRLVLWSSLVLGLAGASLITAYEWNMSLGHLPPWARALNGLFASVAARTAGFNSIDYSATTESTSVLTMILMFIGGAPGSTAGGLKVTTFALIGLAAWARLRGMSRLDLWNRTVPEATVSRAVGLLVLAIGVSVLGIIVFTLGDFGVRPEEYVRGRFLPRAFEVTSALNTVGLSMGQTASLTPVQKLTSVLLMLIGRVGTLTFVAAISMPRKAGSGSVRHAHEDVLIG
jgi:trk system potassium uptake protein